MTKLIKVQLDLTATNKADMIRQLQDVIWDVKKLPKVPYYAEKNATSKKGTVQPLLPRPTDDPGADVPQLRGAGGRGELPDNQPGETQPGTPENLPQLHQQEEEAGQGDEGYRTAAV